FGAKSYYDGSWDEDVRQSGLTWCARPRCCRYPLPREDDTHPAADWRRGGLPEMRGAYLLECTLPRSLSCPFPSSLPLTSSSSARSTKCASISTAAAAQRQLVPQASRRTSSPNR